MKRNLIWLNVFLLIVLIFSISSCSQSTTTPPTSTTQTSVASPTSTTQTSATSSPPTSTTPTPTPAAKYGGTFTLRVNADPTHFDPYNLSGGVSQTAQKLFLETLAGRDLSVDRSVYDFKSSYTPLKYSRGILAESWEVSSDYMTVTFHLRQGIHWQDIPPVNGRELTAYDVEWNWHRELGLGSGFTEPNPYYAGNYQEIGAVTATDKYTVVFTFKHPSLEQLRLLLDSVSYGHVVAPEAVQEWGDVEDWKHAIGTGPYILEEYVAGSSITAVRNPDYWGVDESNPENQLPYFDKIKMLIIPDDATALSGLRSGAIDLVEDVDWVQALSLAKTNPELVQVARPLNSDAIVLRVDKPPFNDIRVRTALQMAIDLNTIAKTYYGGTVDPTPMGLIATPGYYTPFDEWPEAVKEGYMYNPEGAKQLLTEAGYPNGFKCTLTTSSTADLDLWQIIKSYFQAIDVDMEIEVMEPTAFSAYALAGEHQMLGTDGTSGTLVTYPPMNALNQRYSGHKRSFAWGGVSDPIYDALWEQAKTEVNEEKFRNIVKEADDYNISQHWVVNILPKVSYCIYQPWIHGFNGETGFAWGQLFARMWTDKK